MRHCYVTLACTRTNLHTVLELNKFILLYATSYCEENREVKNSHKPCCINCTHAPLTMDCKHPGTPGYLATVDFLLHLPIKTSRTSVFGGRRY
jgi:hypothetical protein